MVADVQVVGWLPLHTVGAYAHWVVGAGQKVMTCGQVVEASGQWVAYSGQVVDCVGHTVA